MKFWFRLALKGNFWPASQWISYFFIPFLRLQDSSSIDGHGYRSFMLSRALEAKVEQKHWCPEHYVLDEELSSLLWFGQVKWFLGQYVCAHKHCTNYNNHSWLARYNDWSKWFYLREGLWSFILPISMFMGGTWERISNSSWIWEILLKAQNTGYGWSGVVLRHFLISSPTQ